MKISERGQVTIPLVYREKYGYLPDTEVSFEVQHGALVLRRTAGAQHNRLKALYGIKKLGRTTDELMALLRDE